MLDGRAGIPHQTIIRSFFWPYTAEDIALGLTEIYHQKISAAKIKDIWIDESTRNPLLQCDRPAKGFPESDEIKLAERLAA